MAAAQQANKFKDEIVPMKTKMKVVDKETKAESIVDYVVDQRRVQPPRHDHGRPRQARAGQGPGKFVTAGNASQLSDGAAAVVLMEAKDAERRGLKPLGALRRLGVAGCEPDEMGIGPVFAVPKLLEAPRPEGRRHRSLGAQRSLRQPVPLFAATSSASIPRSTTSTAARSRSATPSA